MPCGCDGPGLRVQARGLEGQGVQGRAGVEAALAQQRLVGPALQHGQLLAQVADVHVDRARVAALLGFAAAQENSYGCIAACDYVTGVYLYDEDNRTDFADIFAEPHGRKGFFFE